MFASRQAPARSPFARFFRVALGGLGALAAFALALPAEAALLREPGTDLRLNLEVPGAQVCVVVPKSSQVEDDCDDLNLPALEAIASGQADAPTGLAVVRFPTWSFTVMVSAQLGVHPRSSEQLDDFARGVAQGAESQYASVRVHGTAPGSRYDVEAINGIHAIRFQVDLAAPKSGEAAAAMRLDQGALLGNAGFALVAVVVDAAHAAEAEPITRTLLGTAEMPHPTVTGFGQPGSVVTDWITAHPVQSAAGLAVLVAVPVLVLRGARKKKPAPR